MQEIHDPNEEMMEEEWKVIIADTKSEYTLSKKQAHILQEAFARKEKAVVFKTFIISLPFVVEFYRIRRFLKDTVVLPSRTEEEPYVPMNPEKFKKFKEEIYQKIIKGKTMSMEGKYEK